MNNQNSTSKSRKIFIYAAISIAVIGAIGLSLLAFRSDINSQDHINLRSHPTRVFQEAAQDAKVSVDVEVQTNVEVNNNNDNEDLGASTTQYSSTFTIKNTLTRKGKQYYVEGLSFKDSTTLLESAGLYGSSSIHFVNLNTMSVTTNTNLASKYFGEGCDFRMRNGVKEVLQMTYRERALFVFDAATLKLKETKTLPSVILEGWGMATRNVTLNGISSQEIFVSDGSSKIHVFNGSTFAFKRSMQVSTSDKGAMKNLNELEFVEGKLLANVYLTSNVVIINPETGFIEKVINMSTLRSKAITAAQNMGLSIKSDDVLNGIAYYAPTKKLIVTGKRWPVMWEITIPGLNA